MAREAILLRVRLVSVNAGLPRIVEWHGRQIRTSIWKAPVEGRVAVSTLNIAGDAQSDLSVHGGEDKAVYVYPAEHYAYWRGELPDFALPPGSFGENFTTEGLLESEVMIGDTLAIGSAVFVVTQPRSPCYKLGIRFGRDDMVKRFWSSGRSGFYLAVLREGEIAAGDTIALSRGDDDNISVAGVVEQWRAGNDVQ